MEEGNVEATPMSQRLTNEDFRKLLMTPRATPSGGAHPAGSVREAMANAGSMPPPTENKSELRRKKKSYYAALKKQEDNKLAELAEKYRDRARERRDGTNDIGPVDPTSNTNSAYRSMPPPTENKSELRRKKKSYYAALKKQEDNKLAELAEKYRDRARERRDGTNDIGPVDPTSNTNSAYRAVAPDLKSGMDAKERRRQMIQESKYLGGDMEHTHLVKGLDYALLQKSTSAVQAPVKTLNDGNKIPMLALGTGRGTAPQGADVEEVRHAVLWAIEAGYRHIDTAAVYNDEIQVGQGISDAIAKGLVKREDVFVTTKLWSDKHRQEQVVPALRDSLKKLGLDYVDLYLVHFPIALMANGSPDNVDYLDTWKGMEETKELSLAKSIGVSNFNASQLDRLIANSKVKPAVNQIEVNPTLTQEPLVSHCQKQGVAVMAYSPFGFLVTRKRENIPPPRYDDPSLMKMAQKYRKTTSQIALRYLVERDLIPIPKSANKERIAQNIDIFDFKLTNEEVSTISAFNKNIRVIDPKQWKDYPNYPFEQ